MVVGGRFRYADANANKTATKHMTYRQNTLAMNRRLGGNFSNSNNFYAYIDLDHRETRRFVTQWGAEFHDADKNKYSDLDVLDQTIDPIYDYLRTTNVAGPFAVLGVFYGRKLDHTVWGHVVAFCSRGGPTADGPCFFDANSGLWEFGALEDIADAIRTYIRTRYRTNGRTIEAFNTIVLKKRPPPVAAPTP
jgi:hypothetical protein